MARTISRLLNNIALGLDRILNKALKTYRLLIAPQLIDIARAYFIIGYYPRLRILSSPSTILFKRRLIVLAISSIVISLSTLRRVTGVLPVMSLRSTRASQGKNLSIRIFTFLLLLLVVAYSSPTLYRGSRYKSSARRPTFFFTYFTIA